MSVDLEELLNRLSPEEKISLLSGLDAWHTKPIARLGVPSLKMSDGPNGVRGAGGSLATPSACTPVGVALAATWNTALVEQVGTLLGEEARARGVDILLAPMVNLHRAPLAGRNFEAFSEDPYLSSEMACAFIRGVQSRGVGCCIKHFVCNDQEYQRTSISAEVDERPLRELYLEPFRRAIRDARPWALMTAYNRVRGVYASEHDYLLRQVLRGEWNYDGLVLSDWGGTYSDAVISGELDLEMPGPARWMRVDSVQKALATGRLTPAALDGKVRRLLRTLQRAGRLDRPERTPEQELDTPQQRHLLRQAAREAIVLLKNEGVLPLTGLRRLAVLGANARWTETVGGGSATVIPYYTVSALEGIRRRAGEQVVVHYAIGAFSHRFPPCPERESMRTPEGEVGWLLEVYDPRSPDEMPVYRRRILRPIIGFGDIFEQLPSTDELSARLRGFWVARESGPHTLWLETDVEVNLLVNGELLIETQASPTGSEIRRARVEMEAGQSYNLEILCRGMNRQWPGWLRLGYLPPHPPDLIAEAVEVARQSDAAIIVAGLTPDWESEGFDRISMRLPGRQDELIQRVAEVNPRTVVVLNCGSPIEMPWLDRVRAVVQMGYAGQEQGNALAEILFGDVSPSGKLPVTFPRRLEDNPAHINYPGENGRVLYGEGLFVGYRYYDHTDRDVLFPFGHGLSYTRFEYSDLSIQPAEFREDEEVEVSFCITNVGEMPGMEVAQIYIRDVCARLARPPKELKGFVKVALQPGECRRVGVKLNQEAFWFYDPAGAGWVTESGLFEVLVGASSRDIRLRGRVRLLPPEGQGWSRWGLHAKLSELLADERAAWILKRYFGDRVDSPEWQAHSDLTLEEIVLHLTPPVPPFVLVRLQEELADRPAG